MPRNDIEESIFWRGWLTTIKRSRSIKCAAVWRRKKLTTPTTYLHTWPLFILIFSLNIVTMVEFWESMRRLCTCAYACVCVGVRLCMNCIFMHIFMYMQLSQLTLLPFLFVHNFSPFSFIVSPSFFFSFFLFSLSFFFLYFLLFFPVIHL